MSLSSHVSGNGAKTTITHLARFIDVNKDIPKFQLPAQAMSEKAASSIIRNELKLDGNPDLNLASFVTTEVDEECHDLMVANLNKNLVDTSQYGHTSEIQDRCVNILANLFHAPTNDTEYQIGAVGTATVGSSEAIMLGGLALKWRWRSAQAAKQGTLPDQITTRCNLIFSAAVHVSVLKLCRYFDIEARIIPLEEDRYTLDIDQVISRCDENTCGVLAILGTTLTGEFDDIKKLNCELLKLKAEKGLDIPIHVDGASGAMVAPFVFPTVEWDFRLEQVRSINTSGHKYGLVLPGLGWVVWRRKIDLPDDLIFHVNYLGVDEPTFNLNFSRSAATVIGQYYQFIRLGVEGYKKIMNLSVDNANYLAESLMSMSDELFIIRSKNMTFDEAMTEMIRNILKLNKTTMRSPEMLIPHIASFYYEKNDSLINSGMWGDLFLNDLHATGGIMSTMTDLVAYGQIWLNAYLGRSDDFLQQATFKSAWTPGDLGDIGYGSGWIIPNVTADKPNDRHVVWHNGGTCGCSSMLAIYPDTEVIVAVSANLEWKIR